MVYTVDNIGLILDYCILKVVGSQWSCVNRPLSISNNLCVHNLIPTHCGHYALHWSSLPQCPSSWLLCISHTPQCPSPWPLCTALVQYTTVPITGFVLNHKEIKVELIIGSVICYLLYRLLAVNKIMR